MLHTSDVLVTAKHAVGSMEGVTAAGEAGAQVSTTVFGKS